MHLFNYPAFFGTDCDSLDRNHVIWPVAIGGAGGVLNLDRQTGAVLASCGAVDLDETVRRFLVITDAGALHNGGRITSSERIATLPTGQYTFGNRYDYNDVRTGGDGTMFYDRANRLVVFPTDIKELQFRSYQEIVVVTEAGNDLRERKDPVGNMLAAADDGNRLLYDGDPDSGSFSFRVRAYETLSNLDDKGTRSLRDDTVTFEGVSDGVSYEGEIVSALGMESFFYVAIRQTGVGTSLVYIAADGTTTNLGMFPADPSDAIQVENNIGVLMPFDACLYAAANDTVLGGQVLMRRCVTGEYAELIRIPDCDPWRNFCLFGATAARAAGEP